VRARNSSTSRQLATSAADPAVDALLARVHRDFPAPARFFLVEGIRRLVEYLDADYALDYVDRMHSIAVLDRKLGGEAAQWRLTRETARWLALWMAYEDTIRVADLNTSPRSEQLHLIRQCANVFHGAQRACYRWLGMTLNVVTNGDFMNDGCNELRFVTTREACKEGAAAYEGPLETFS
jgi:hypothetical protein